MVLLIQTICTIFALIKIAEGDISGSHNYVAACLVIGAIHFKKL